MSTAPVICPILVGRDDLLDRIDQLIDQARSGHGHALLRNFLDRLAQPAL